METKKGETDRSSDVKRNDDNNTSSDENSDCNKNLGLEYSSFEAGAEEGRTMQVYLPNGTIVDKRVYPMESAFQFKEKCLGEHYPQLQKLTVFLCNDSRNKYVEKTLQDTDYFKGLLDEYQFIRIRFKEGEDSANMASNPGVNMKTCQ